MKCSTPAFSAASITVAPICESTLEGRREILYEILHYPSHIIGLKKVADKSFQIPRIRMRIRSADSSECTKTRTPRRWFSRSNWSICRHYFPFSRAMRMIFSGFCLNIASRHLISFVVHVRRA